jgi:hypothetical protein
VFRDITGAFADTLTSGADGTGEFRCADRSVSVWVEQP